MSIRKHFKPDSSSVLPSSSSGYSFLNKKDLEQANQKVLQSALDKPQRGKYDKRQITAVLAASMAGEYLPPQLLFQGKTERCHPKVDYLKGRDVWHSENHWSNEDTMKRYAEHIIIPFMDQKRKALMLTESHPVLVLFDRFRGQTTAAIESMLKEHHIISIRIPPNCTDKLPPMDVSINKPVKHGMRTRFQTCMVRQ